MVIPCNIKKGSSATTLVPSDSVEVDDTVVVTAAQLRVFLKSVGSMEDSDKFLTKDKFPLNKASEGSIAWKDLVVGDSIQILTVPVDDKPPKFVPLKEFPKDPKLWDTDIEKGEPLPRIGPTGIPVPDGTIPMPTDVDSFVIDHWVVVCRNNNLFKGIRIDSDEGPRPSGLLLVEPSQNFHPSVGGAAFSESITMYTERNSKYVKQGWTQASASVSTPWVSSSVQAKSQEMSAKNIKTKKIFTTGVSRFPFVSLQFRTEELRLTQNFKDEIKKALAKTTDEEKRVALAKVFSAYGHIFQTEVDIGGLCVTLSSLTVSSEAEQKKFEDSTVAAVSAASKFVGGDATFSTGSSTNSVNTKIDQGESYSFSCKGGNPLLTNNVSKWLPTVADYRTWRVIKTAQIIPVIDLLDDETRKLVEPLAPTVQRPLTGMWTETRLHFEPVPEVGFSGGFIPQTYPLLPPIFRPDLGTVDKWQWIGQTLDGKRALAVRETIPGSGALCKLTTEVNIHAWSSDFDHDDVNLWKLVPEDPEYACLGTYSQSKRSQHDEVRGPDLNGDPVLQPIRGIRKEFLVQVPVGDVPVWKTDEGMSSNPPNKQNDRTSYWRPAENFKAGEPVFDPGLFVAIHGFNKPADLSIFLIKESAITMLPGTNMAT